MDAPPGYIPYDQQGPFLEFVGPVHVREDGDGRVFGLRAEERHANQRGTVMGGLMATLADFALGRAIEADADDDEARATVSLTVDYLRPAKPGDWIETRARVDRVGGTLAFAEVSLLADGKELLRGRGVWAAV
jgi:uncharacterized protein (TIGR00369 family)